MGKDKEKSVAEEFVVTAVEKIGMDMDSIKDSIAGIAGKVIGLERKYTELKTGEKLSGEMLERHLAETTNAVGSAVNKAFETNSVKVEVPPPLPAKLSKEDSEKLERLEKNLEPKVVRCHDRLTCAIATLMGIVSMIFASADVWYHDNDYKAWAARYVEMSELAGDMHPGDKYIYIRDEFRKGRKERRAARLLVKSEEQRLEPRRSNISFFKEKLSELLQRDVVILDYETADIDEEKRTYKALVIFREPDSEKQYRALFTKEGDVFVTADTDIHTLRQAEKYLGRKEWRKMS